MPIFSFKLRSGQEIVDASLVELPHIAAAQKEAIRRISAALLERQDDFWRDEDWTLDVTDQAGLILFSVAVSAFFSPGSGSKFAAND